MGSGEPGVSLETSLTLLANPYRRYVLEDLLGWGRSSALPELTWSVAMRFHEAGGTDVSRDALDSIQIRLHHVHLPKLAAAGLIDYDCDRRTADLAAEPVHVRQLLADASAD